MIATILQNYPNYLVFENCLIINKNTMKELHPWMNHSYLCVKLGNENGFKRVPLHRVICEAFHPNPENKPYINHKDGNKLNNLPINLEWCTSKENTRHAMKTGLFKPGGENNGRAKLSESDVKFIRKMCNHKKYHKRELANMFNVSLTQIYNVANRKLWKHV